MTTPAKPRPSGLPTPGRGGTGIPTPGRSRASSSAYHVDLSPPDDMSRAFADAIKANDPSQHRIIPPSNSSSTASLSPQSMTHSLSSGRRSVAGRPSSSMSTSSNKIQERAKTPITTRVASRPPSRQSETVTKPLRAFSVGDNVRIESLGFEGVLRYVGDIENKPGLWAGVELSGGFAGKGKNDGTVGGKQYFSCPDKCGVFVATTKLSPPTVGPGAIQRPSSVASSRSGRMTPASSGRITPSFTSTRTPSGSYAFGRSTTTATTPSATNRVIPSLSNGRVTPSTVLPKSRVMKTPTSKTSGVHLSGKITAGSRASKYMTMTAKQLTTRDRGDGIDSPTRKIFGGPSPTMSRTMSSPTRLPGSPFTTPKALNARPSMIVASPSLPSSRTRPSLSTPRARVPSNVSMPPPPSPGTFQIRSAVSDDFASCPSPNYDHNGRLSYKPIPQPSSSRPSSSASFRSTVADDVALVEQLQSRLEAAEYENARLRTSAEVELGASASTHREELDVVREERQSAVDSASRLEAQLLDIEGRVKSYTERIEVLEAENVALSDQLKEARAQAEEAALEHQSALESLGAEMRTLEEKMAEMEGLDSEKGAVQQANMALIEELQTKLDMLNEDMELERRELIAQIDELRVAGQETIALYEGRRSADDAERYELEKHISALEGKIRTLVDASRSTASPTAAVLTSSAAQIDNETLRDQVQYLQSKAATLEEQLEDTRAALERDVGGFQDKIALMRLDDERLRRDLAMRTREMEQLIKSEAGARGRVEEIEEALRESTVALETARGEVEVLRAELADLDVLIDDASEDDIASKLVNFTKRAAAEKTQHQLEIDRLQRVVADLQRGNEELLLRATSAPPAVNGHHTHALESENEDLRDQLSQLEEKVADLAKTLHERTTELETTRKKAHRDTPLANVTKGGADLMRSNSSKGDPAREEVAGLKHIVQELQKENLSSSQKIKLLQSENELLSNEAEQLRQEVRILEEDMDASIANTSGHNLSPSKADRTPTMESERSMRSEAELEQLRKRVSDMEVQHARTIHGLNKEISELEALVESKIYREDELEQEVDRLKEKVARKKSSKEGGNRLSTASSITLNGEHARVEEVCEICERPGHDIFNCSLLKDERPVEIVCGDCESPGHTAANCPHSQDVF